jgi:hypothetical protein
MSNTRFQILVALILLAVSVSTLSPSFAYSGKWHVVEDLSTQSCFRVPYFAPQNGWRDFGRFNTFRMAGAWVWRHRNVCIYSPVFE